MNLTAIFLLVPVLTSLYSRGANACGLCVAPVTALSAKKITPIAALEALLIQQKRPVMVGLTGMYMLTVKIRRRRGFLAASDTEEEPDALDKELMGDDEHMPKTTSKKDDDGSDKPMSAAMIGTIGIYKNWISPLLPPACRFVPTCSQYGVQAIEQYGPSKGVLLTAWRLMRCSPIGGKGYDPPKWPPVSFTYSSY